MKSSEVNSKKRILYYVVIIILLYVFTSAKVTTETVEVEIRVEQKETTKELITVEKLVKTTKYRTEKSPYGPQRCEQLIHNFTREYEYFEEYVNNEKVGTCTFFVANLEDVPGNFTFYSNIIKGGKISDSPDLTKEIGAFSVERFEWNISLGLIESANCLLQCSDCPKRKKCLYLEPIAYQLKEVPYIVEELKNITEYKETTEIIPMLVKQNITMNVYTNRFFGYKQFLYFGY